MTDTIAGFNNRFKVNSVSISENSDIRFNIIKRREAVIYKTLSDADHVNLAYLFSPALVSDDNIFASKKADEFPPNILPKQEDHIIFNGRTINLSVNNFLATDEFLKLNNGQLVPLFYKHILKNFDPTNTNQILSDLVLLDQSLHNVVLEESTIDYTNGIIYNNLKNTFDFKSGDYSLTYVRYTVRNDLDGSINSFTEIVNNQTVYRQAAFEDLTSGGELPPDLKVYTLDPDPSTNTFEINFSNTRTYAILESEDSRIRIIKPTGLGSNNPWFCSVTNGNFFTSIKTSPTTSNVFGYNIPEFAGQLFDPFSPFKHRSLEASEFVNHRTIKTLKNNIQYDVVNGLFITVIGRNVDGTARFAVSNDPTKIGTAFETVTYTADIRSIDSSNGFIDLSIEIFDSDTIAVSYYYAEKQYEILDIDFNPLTNSDIVGQRVIFYTVPNTLSGRSKTLYYLLVDHNGIIKFGNQPDNTALQTDIGTGTFKYDVPSISPYHLNYLDKYTVHARTIYEFANPFSPKHFVLSEVSTADVKHSSDSVIVDVRTDGGGIKPSVVDTLVADVPEVLWSTNLMPSDGYQYPKNGATYIEVPTSVQLDYGGQFTDIQLKKIAERHIAMGMYAIMRGYNTNVVFTAEPITDNSNNVSIVLAWRTYGANKSYNVYLSLFPDHGYAKVNTTPLADNPAGNTYTINSGLLVNTIYWVYVVSCDTISDYPQTVIGTDPNHTYENPNKIQVQTYKFPS